MDEKFPSVLASKYLVILAAACAALVFAHWLVVQPAPVALARGEAPMFVWMLFASVQNSVGAYFLKLALGLIAITGIAACGLAIVISVKAAQSPTIRYLGAALAFCALGAAYFFFATTHEVYRALIGWSWGQGWRAVLDFFFYTLDLLSPLFLYRFFRAYPRDVTDEQLQQHYGQIMSEARGKLSQDWRRYFYPQLRADPAVPTIAARFIWPRLPGHGMARVQRYSNSPAIYWCVLAIALMAAAADFLGRSTMGTPSAGSPSAWVKMFMSATFIFTFLFFVCGGLVSFEYLQFHHRNALPADRVRIDWIYATMLVAGIILLCVTPLWWALLPWLIPQLEVQAIAPPGPVMFMGPTVIAIELFVMAFVVALALSIFYRGAVDPRLAARKFTVLGVLGLAVAFLFILIERTVALKLVAFFNLSPDTGALIASVAVAATIAPVKGRAEKAVNLFVGRFLPLDSLIEGQRQVIAVAISDLSGYTALSAHDEKQALLLAALLQRQATKLTEANGGRIVKSMGDAVMFAFDDATTAAKVLTALHRDFATAAESLGVVALPVHSGAHLGEVTVAHDGDIYGQTVNIAARIQGGAAPSQILVSEAFAAAAESSAYRDLGLRQFKNVPVAVSCRELLLATPPPLQVAVA